MIAYRLQMPVVDERRCWLQNMPRLADKGVKTAFAPGADSRDAAIEIAGGLIAATATKSLLTWLFVTRPANDLIKLMQFLVRQTV